jgi:fructose-1,6-bisphosphatase
MAKGIKANLKSEKTQGSQTQVEPTYTEKEMREDLVTHFELGNQINELEKKQKEVAKRVQKWAKQNDSKFDETNNLKFEEGMIVKVKGAAKLILDDDMSEEEVIIGLIADEQEDFYNIVLDKAAVVKDIEENKNNDFWAKRGLAGIKRDTRYDVRR